VESFPEPPQLSVALPAPEPNPARLGDRARAALEVVLCSSLLTQLAIGGVAASLGLAPSTRDGHLAMPFVVTVALADTVILIALMAWLTVARGDSVRRLWIGTRAVAIEARHGLLLTPLVFLLVVVTMLAVRQLAPWLHNVATNPLEQMATRDLSSGLLLAVVAIVAGGLREELQRAFLLDRFERHLGGSTVGVVVLSVAFGLGHYVQGWDVAIATGMMGAFWAVVYLRRRSAVGPIVSHSTFNSLEILRVLVGTG
jgi:membrane protease YdiL (CAAX protease family)